MENGEILVKGTKLQLCGMGNSRDVMCSWMTMVNDTGLNLERC